MFFSPLSLSGCGGRPPLCWDAAGVGGALQAVIHWKWNTWARRVLLWEFAIYLLWFRHPSSPSTPAAASPGPSQTAVSARPVLRLPPPVHGSWGRRGICHSSIAAR